MSSRPSLKLDWCSYKAAKYAVEHWHYSKRMPRSKLAKIGVWEDGRFIGAIIYGVGSGNSTDGRRFGLAKRFEMAELVRVALCPHHETPTSKVVAVSVRIIKKTFPKLRLLTSFADVEQGHVGTIYQAAGWYYVGKKTYDNGYYLIKGERVWPRTLHDRYGRGGQSLAWLRANIDPNAQRCKTERHHYLLPLDDAVRRRIEPLTLPYPKRARSETSDTPATHAGEGGAAPTLALQQAHA